MHVKQNIKWKFNVKYLKFKNSIWNKLLIESLMQNFFIIEGLIYNSTKIKRY